LYLFQSNLVNKIVNREIVDPSVDLSRLVLLQMTNLTVISPVFNSVQLVERFGQTVAQVFDQLKLPYQLILVDDCSSDGSWQAIQDLCKINPNVSGYRLNKNAGQHLAIWAGICLCDETPVIVLDSDFQDDPGDIPKFLEKAKGGCEVVVGFRTKRPERGLRWLMIKLTHLLLAPREKVFSHSFEGVFRFLSAKTVSELKSQRPRFANIVAQTFLISKKPCTIDIERKPAVLRKSSYNVRRYFHVVFNYWLNYKSISRPIRALLPDRKGPIFEVAERAQTYRKKL